MSNILPFHLDENIGVLGFATVWGIMYATARTIELVCKAIRHPIRFTKYALRQTIYGGMWLYNHWNWFYEFPPRVWLWIWRDNYNKWHEESLRTGKYLIEF